jgi:uncharacterized protein YbjT (DUF2867 family)
VFLQISAAVAPALIPRMARAALTAARDAGVAHVVMTSSSVIPPAAGRCRGPDARVELLRTVREVLPRTVVLRPTLLLDNFSGPLRPALDGRGGPAGHPRRRPRRLHQRGGPGGLRRRRPGPPELAGELLPIAGADSVTGPQLADVLGRAMGKQLTYLPLSEVQVREALAFAGEEVAAAVAQMYAWEGTTAPTSSTPT